MRTIFKLGVLTILILISGQKLFAQKKDKDKKGKDKIDLVRADKLGGGKKKKAAVFSGNVIFKQGETYLYCDSALHYDKKNYIEAFGNVRITQGDSVSLSGDKLTYDGNTKKAVMTGNVFLRDKNMNLSTKYLEYDMQSKQAYYIGGGTINDGKTTLTSELGYYSTAFKTFRFKKNVRVVNNVKNYTLISDTLHYNSITKIATFKGPTTIQSSQGTIIANEGEYNTVTGQSKFEGKGSGAQVRTGSYTLTADHIYYDEKRKVGVVKKNVRLYSEKDKIIIEGDEGFYWENTGISKVYGNALMKNVVSGDTLYLTADTLISIDNIDPLKKRLLAFHHTKLFKSDLQGKCDSLAYNFADSTIYFYKDPVLWNAQNQITADSINMELVNQKIHRMNLNLNSFIVSQDSLKNFNQVKGKNMTAFFKEDEIYRVNVNGNGESIYFALENDTTLTGMNKVICSNMIIRLQDNKVATISFLEKPDGKFVPPHELAEPDKRLKGFKWRKEERPKFEQFPIKRL
ncbi:MAG: hypothetical protein K2X86_04570 [Cytophagaceae bacterium]|nr:hypothetical protein [Cytophagaceae bacterium]